MLDREENKMTIQSINPRTEEVVFEIESSTEAKVKETVASAKDSYKNWASKPKEERIEAVSKLSQVIEKRKEEIIKTIYEECGFDAAEIEAVVLDVIDGVEYYSENYRKLENIKFPIDQNVFPQSTSEIIFQPLGVVGQIGAWNYPFWQTMITAIPAILTGNTIVFKPSEKCSKIGKLIHEIFTEIAPGVFNIIFGNATQGKLLVASPVDAIVYTGNIETGEEIIQKAGTRPGIFELSGNDAAIVCHDCDIQQTVAGVVAGAFLHSGEVCDRIKRVYVVKDVAHDFLPAIIKKTNEIQDLITPLIRREALEKVAGQVKQNVKEGAKVLAGGKKRGGKGFYYDATILEIFHNDMPSVHEEIFGPVLTVLVVQNEDEAVKFANATRYGLGTSIWTQDLSRARKRALEAQSGMVWINDSNIPLVCGEYFKGWKATGIPNASSRLMQFLKSKTLISFNSNQKRAWWF